MPIKITGGQLFNGENNSTDHHLKVESTTNKHIELDDQHMIIPGMLDMHIHGSKGCDVMDGTHEALQAIADSLLEQGTTAFLATTMSAKPEKLTQVLTNVASFAKQQTRGAKIIGVHLEGPFISPEYVGAQKADQVLDPDITLIAQWQKLTNNIIKMVTLAPEQSGGIEFVKQLTQMGIIPSFGHSNANYQQTQDGIDAGITHATHLFNAMTGIHHRKPGAVTALLLRDEVYAEIIADGHHLANGIIDLCYRQKTAERLMLVTDATRAQCMPDGIYELGGQAIYLKDNTVRLENGTLAGSILTLPEAIHIVMQSTQCSLNDIVKMTSLNPAKQLNCQPIGYTILDKNFQVCDVIV